MMEKTEVTANEVGNGAVRVTIPKKVREGLGIQAGSILYVWRHGKTIIYEVKTDGT
ncbi:MAG: AbrB/MazE/SpoVT family DNA-binding domain-containing protein [Methanoregula sp.]|jgi:AbrB family looped-hinge helix DNA binding protein|nr:AbrB/MazE/SpoVT family DNA-binding domain-containing protein [Methanoregula sp.]